MFESEVREGLAIRTPSPAPAELQESMARIACLLAAGDLAGLIETIGAMVPEYRPSSLIYAAMEARGTVR